MIGPARAGKTLLARATPGIQPRVKIEKALDVTRIFTVADQLTHALPLIQNSPFRASLHSSLLKFGSGASLLHLLVKIL